MRNKYLKKTSAVQKVAIGVTASFTVAVIAGAAITSVKKHWSQVTIPFQNDDDESMSAGPIIFDAGVLGLFGMLMCLGTFAAVQYLPKRSPACCVFQRGASTRPSQDSTQSPLTGTVVELSQDEIKAIIDITHRPNHNLSLAWLSAAENSSLLVGSLDMENNKWLKVVQNADFVVTGEEEKLVLLDNGNSLDNFTQKLQLHTSSSSVSTTPH